MLRIFLAAIFFITQTDTTFAKNTNEGTPSFDNVIRVFEFQYNQSKTVRDLIIKGWYGWDLKKSLLKFAWDNGAYSKTLPALKITKSSQGAKFVFDNTLTVEMRPQDGSFWINDQRLQLDKIKNQEMLFQSIEKLAAKKYSHRGIGDLIMPPAQAILVPILVTIGAVSILAFMSVMEIGMSGQQARGITDGDYSKAWPYSFQASVVKSGEYHFKKYFNSKEDFLINFIGVKSARCDEKPAPGKKSLPKEVILYPLDLATATRIDRLDKNRERVFKLSHSADGNIEMINASPWKFGQNKDQPTCGRFGMSCTLEEYSKENFAYDVVLALCQEDPKLTKLNEKLKQSTIISDEREENQRVAEFESSLKNSESGGKKSKGGPSVK